MKMVKSLLLGSAAGLVAVAGAQAADLPVKAKPVQYVKICSLYGVGFYYIPGTDMCLKIGGWVRAEYAFGANGNMATGPYRADTNNRLTNYDVWRSRGYITADARNQSEYGTIRSYIAVGLNSSNWGPGASDGGIGFSANRAFIQFAGFTFGLSQSFFDFYSVPASAYFGYYPSEDTGDPGWQVAAYTAQFGNGFSATISAEMRRVTQIIGGMGAEVTGGPNGIPGATGSYVLGAVGAGAYGGFDIPDFVANVRVDQAWGSAQLMGALHEVKAQYYVDDLVPDPGVNAGHPSNKWGFAVGAGIKLLAPMVGPGDYFQAEVNYTQGALGYLFSTPGSFNFGIIKDNNRVGWGIMSDAIYGGQPAAGNSTPLELTTAWSVNAAYDHFWNKQWRTSLYGGYAAVSYNDSANSMACLDELGGLLGLGAVGTGVFGSLSGIVKNAMIPGCDNNWNTWWIGSRTQWNITPDTYLGVDVLYQTLQTATLGIPGGFSPYVSPDTEVIMREKNMDNWSVRFRVHKDFYP